MALRGILGVTLGLAAAIGGAAFAAKKLFGSSDTDGQFTGEPAGMMSGDVASAPREGLDPTLLEILACPDDKEPVIYQKEGDAERLTCTKCGKRYPVRDGIPVMLIDEATPGPAPTEAEIAAAKALISQGKPALVGASSAVSGTGTSGTSGQPSAPAAPAPAEGSAGPAGPAGAAGAAGIAGDQDGGRA
jgi:uncharacterized protein YbaR (Trm112 family)